MADIHAIADRAALQLAVYPVQTGKEKLKRLIKKNILRQKLAPTDPFSWPCAMLAEGLLAAFWATGEESCKKAAEDYLKQWKSAGFSIHYVDNIMNGWLAMWMEELLEKQTRSDRKPDGPQSAKEPGTRQDRDAGQPQTRQCRDAGQAELLQICREAREACARWLLCAPKSDGGILQYRTWHPDWAFADTVGMVCPFLCRYGATHENEELLELGIRQQQQFLQKGMDAATGLPYHGYDEKSGMKLGIIGWGRACGWLLCGLAKSLPWIPKDRREYPELLAAFQKLAAATAKYQRSDGGFSWQLQALEGHKDTSAEGMIGMAIAAGRRAGLLPEGGGTQGSAAYMAEPREKTDVPSMAEPREKTDVPCMAELQEQGSAAYMGNAGGVVDLSRLKASLERSIKDGVITDCSGECRGFAEYPQVYGSYPWGTGSGLAFLAEYEFT